MRIKFIIILFVLFLFQGFLMAYEKEKTTVRVGLSNQTFSSQEFESITISSMSAIKIIDMSTNVQIEPIEAGKMLSFSIDNSLFNISINNELKHEKLSGPLLLSSNSDFEVINLNRKGTPAKYKGMFELRAAKKPNRFNVINVVDIQNYLRGVVPNEMPVSFGLEAIKAQAVAARNYVQRANINPNYDVVDSTASQVYYGVNSYRDITDSAVEKTKGIFALYKDTPISALYFSTSPGITDDWDDVFGSGYPSDKHPYLKAKYDSVEQKPLKTEQDVIDFYSKKDNGLDTNSPKFRWSVEFSKEELENTLKDTLLQQSKANLVTPKYDGSIPLEGLVEIKPIKRTQSGKVVELEIRAKNGEYRIKKELGIRRLFKKQASILPSGNFYIETTYAPDKQDNKEQYLLQKIFEGDQKDPKSFKFIGGGFGHSVGMSQFGAYNLAKKGVKYPDILKYYYSGISISTMTKTVLYNEYNISYKTEFYFDKDAYKEAYLYIDNQRGVSQFPFSINGFEFLDTKQINKTPVIKMNITQYLKQGNNTINFLPLSLENKGKYVVYRVELL